MSGRQVNKTLAFADYDALAGTIGEVGTFTPARSKNELVERGSGQHFDHAHQLDAHDIQVGMPFSHVDHRLL